jgi:hypothetical protein
VTSKTHLIGDNGKQQRATKKVLCHTDTEEKCNFSTPRRQTLKKNSNKGVIKGN